MIVIIIIIIIDGNNNYCYYDMNVNIKCMLIIKYCHASPVRATRQRVATSPRSLRGTKGVPRKGV